MKKAIGFNLGQRGDLCMNSVVARQLKEQLQDVHLILGIEKKYADTAPLFFNHPHIDSIHIYEGYDDWPTQEDKKYLINQKFDLIFHGLPNHTRDDWWKFFHQTEEVCLMNGLNKPKSTKCFLTKWFDTEKGFKNFIAFAPFAGFYNKKNNEKTLSFEKAQTIVNDIISLGYNVLQLGGPDEPQLKGAVKINVDYFSNIKNMLSCKALIHTDTGCGWIASAYGFPCVGLYSNQYYGKEFVKNIQPTNENSIYLDDICCNSIDNIKVIQALKNIFL
jgi:ADP-heptose:LPS heptosyltransferase